MRKELPCCKPASRTTGTTNLFYVKNVLSIFLLMTFLCCSTILAQPAKIDLDQLRNGGNAGPPPGSATSWVNGNLGSSNSHYREGYSVPYRVRINNIPIGVTITVRFGYDIKHSGRNALDYLTYYRRNQPHTGWTPEHVEEAVDPLDGAQGTYGAPSFAPIPCPTINATYIPPTPNPQPSTSCNTLPNVVNPPGLPAGRQHEMTIWNGTIDSIRFVYEGDLNAAQSEAAIKVSFKATSSDVVIAWGGHIGSRIDWGYDAQGVPRSAGGISGSPYHMRILSWGVNGTGVQDGTLPNLGNTDRSLSADAVARPPECLDLDFTTNATNPLCPGTVNTYGVVINPLACSSPAYQWAIPPSTNNSGATIVGSNTGQNIQINSGTQCGGFTLQVTIICTEGMITCDTTINVIDLVPPTLSINNHNPNAGCNPASIPFGTPVATDNCNGTVSITSSTGAVTSSGCNRSQTRFWTATDACGNSSSTSRTVSWVEDNTPPVITISGYNANAGCNPTSLAFGTASATDNCGTPTLTSSTGAVISSGCNRSQTRFWTATDACQNSSSTSRTVSWVEDRTPPTFSNPPASVDLECYQSVPSVPTVTATDNCGSATVTYNGETDVPSNCTTGFQRIITRSWTATDACGNTATHTQTIRIKCCIPVCTLTQGGYGQYGGSICLPNGTTVLQHSLMASAIDPLPGDSVVFGKQSNNRYWVVTLADVNQGANSNILKMLPGGGGSFVLGLDNYTNAPKYSNTASWPVAPLQPNGSQTGRIKNTLLAQTITFFFNTKIPGSGLGSIILNGDSAIISQRECGTNNPIPGTRDTVALISQTVASYMATHGYTANAAGLLQLANDALGGVNISPLSLSDVAGAVDRINNVFDNCVLFEGYVPYVSGRTGNTNAKVALPANDLNVTAFPNPYEDQNFSLRINAPVGGEATIQFFTIDGQQITQMKRTIVANRDEVVNFKVPGLQKTKIAYLVTIGKYNSKGIVLNPN